RRRVQVRVGEVVGRLLVQVGERERGGRLDGAGGADLDDLVVGGGELGVGEAAEHVDAVGVGGGVGDLDAGVGVDEADDDAGHARLARVLNAVAVQVLEHLPADQAADLNLPHAPAVGADGEDAGGRVDLEVGDFHVRQALAGGRVVRVADAGPLERRAGRVG